MDPLTSCTIQRLDAPDFLFAAAVSCAPVYGLLLLAIVVGKILGKL